MRIALRQTLTTIYNNMFGADARARYAMPSMMLSAFYEWPLRFAASAYGPTPASAYEAHDDERARDTFADASIAAAFTMPAPPYGGI